MTAIAAMQSCIEIVGAFGFSWILRRELWAQNHCYLFWQTACSDGLSTTTATHKYLQVQEQRALQTCFMPHIRGLQWYKKRVVLPGAWVTHLRVAGAVCDTPLGIRSHCGHVLRAATHYQFHIFLAYSSTFSLQIAPSQKGSVWIKLLSKAHVSPSHQHFLSSHLKKTALRTFQPKAAMWSLSCFRFTQALR